MNMSKFVDKLDKITKDLQDSGILSFWMVDRMLHTTFVSFIGYYRLINLDGPKYENVSDEELRAIILVKVKKELLHQLNEVEKLEKSYEYSKT